MQLPDLPPGDFNATTAVIGLVMALWGGAVSYAHRILRGVVRCSIREFLLEMFISLFSGFLVFVFAIWFGVPPLVAGAFAGLGGHSGTRTIFLFTKIFFKQAETIGKKRS